MSLELDNILKEDIDNQDFETVLEEMRDDEVLENLCFDNNTLYKTDIMKTLFPLKEDKEEESEI